MAYGVELGKICELDSKEKRKVLDEIVSDLRKTPDGEILPDLYYDMQREFIVETVDKLFNLFSVVLIHKSQD